MTVSHKIMSPSGADMTDMGTTCIKGLNAEDFLIYLARFH